MTDRERARQWLTQSRVEVRRFDSEEASLKRLVPSLVTLLESIRQEEREACAAKLDEMRADAAFVAEVNTLLGERAPRMREPLMGMLSLAAAAIRGPA